jgi:hypothetical protein
MQQRDTTFNKWVKEKYKIEKKNLERKKLEVKKKKNNYSFLAIN